MSLNSETIILVGKAVICINGVKKKRCTFAADLRSQAAPQQFEQARLRSVCTDIAAEIRL